MIFCVYLTEFNLWRIDDDDDDDDSDIDTDNVITNIASYSMHNTEKFIITKK